MVVINPNIELYKIATSKPIFIRHKRGVVLCNGADRLDLIHRLSTNTTRDMKPNDEVENIFTTDKGRIMCVFRLLAFNDFLLLITPNMETANTTINWLDKYTIMDDFSTTDVSAEYDVISIYGDEANEIITAFFDITPPNSGKFATVTLGDKEAFIIRANRLCGATGFSIILPKNSADIFASSLAEIITELDSATYLTLRIEAGLPTFGADLNENYNPLESGVANLISWTKGCYIGQEVIARLDTYDKVQRHLCGLIFEGNIFEGNIFEGNIFENNIFTNDISEKEDTEFLIYSVEEQNKIGNITSVCYSPKFDKIIALGYIRSKYAVAGNIVEIKLNDEVISKATISKLPF